MERSELVNPQQRLPNLSLPAASSGEPQPLRPRGRSAAVVVLVHGGECAECRAYLEALAAEAEALREWDGRLSAIVPEPSDGAHLLLLAPALRVLVDPEQRVARASGVAPPALLIADRWGVLHLTHDAGADHEWPAPAEVVSWLRYLAIRCPECEGEAL